MTTDELLTQLRGSKTDLVRTSQSRDGESDAWTGARTSCVVLCLPPATEYPRWGRTGPSAGLPLTGRLVHTPREPRSPASGSSSGWLIFDGHGRGGGVGE